MFHGFEGFRKRCFLPFALGSLLCSAVLAQSVNSSYLPGTDFSKYRTYNWVEIKGRQHPDPTKDAEIKQLIDSQLAAKGLAKTDGTADLSLDYQVAIDRTETWQTYEDWSSAALMDSRVPLRKKVTIEVGMLVIDMYDTAAKKLVWTGTGKKTMEKNSSTKQKQKVIQALFKSFPPK